MLVNQEVLQEAVTEMMIACLERRFRLPLYMLVVGGNGAAIFTRYTEPYGCSDVDILAEHLQQPGFELPVTVFCVDPDGKAARLLIDGAGASRISVLKTKPASRTGKQKLPRGPVSWFRAQP